MIPREEVIAQLKPLLKTAGFKKTGTTWHKAENDVICVFNIQASLYSSDYYINVAVYLKAFGDEKKPLERNCHIRTRVRESNSTHEIFNEAMATFEKFDNVEKLTNLNEMGLLPPTTWDNVKEYLFLLENKDK